MLEELDRLSVDELVACFHQGWSDELGPEAPDRSLLCCEIIDRLAGRGARGVEAILGLFEHLEPIAPGREEERAAVVFGLGSVGALPEAVLDRIRSLIDDPSPRVAAAAIDALRRRGDVSSLAAVQKRFPVSPSEVATEALKFLVQRSVATARADLIAGLAHPESQVRFAAVNLIADLGWADLVKAARRVADDPDEDVRALVARYLA